MASSVPHYCLTGAYWLTYVIATNLRFLLTVEAQDLHVLAIVAGSPAMPYKP